MRQDTTANRLARAIGDMEETQHYLIVLWKLGSGSLKINEDFIAKSIRKAAFVAAIIAYSRPFKKSNSDGNADRSLNITDQALFSGAPRLYALHNKIIEKRDRAVAHADWKYHPSELIGIQEDFTIRNSPRPDYTEGITLDAFQRLSELVCKKCIELAYERDVKIVQGKNA